jgi:hypothetical protein
VLSGIYLRQAIFMMSNILSVLNIEFSRLMTNKVINLCTPAKKEPFGFLDIKDGLVHAHFGYYENIRYARQVLEQ